MNDTRQAKTYVQLVIQWMCTRIDETLVKGSAMDSNLIYAKACLALDTVAKECETEVSEIIEIILELNKPTVVAPKKTRKQLVRSLGCKDRYENYLVEGLSNREIGEKEGLTKPEVSRTIRDLGLADVYTRTVRNDRDWETSN